MAENWTTQQKELEEFAQTFYKRAKVRPKSGWIWKCFKFSQHAAVTVGNTVYIPEDWQYYQAKNVIPHEVAGHVKQYLYCGFGIHPKIGIPIFGLIYGLVFLPVLLAWARYRMELHAETQAWKYYLDQKEVDGEWIIDKAESFAKHIASSVYLWAIPLRWAFWGFNKRANKVIEEYNATK